MDQHSITQLNPTVRSSIRNQVYRVLAHHASSGNHGPLSIKSLFLMIAEGLVEQGVIERPEFLGGKGAGGQRFVQLNVPHPTKTFPDYGIPNNIANLIRQTFWELYLQGVLAPAPNFRAIVDQYQEKRQWVSGGLFLDLDHVMLTPYGVDVLIESKNRIRVYDPDGYLANFWNATPSPDPEMMRYLRNASPFLQRAICWRVLFC